MNAKPFTDKQYKAVARMVAQGLKLERERAPRVEYAGTFSAGRAYKRAQLVTHRGTLWHAEADTTDAPGMSSAWRLMVKHARE